MLKNLKELGAELGGGANETAYDQANRGSTGEDPGASAAAAAGRDWDWEWADAGLGLTPRRTSDTDACSRLVE